MFSIPAFCISPFYGGVSLAFFNPEPLAVPYFWHMQSGQQRHYYGSSHSPDKPTPSMLAATGPVHGILVQGVTIQTWTARSRSSLRITYSEQV